MTTNAATIQEFGKALPGHCFEYRGSVLFSAHFPGGRFDATIGSSGEWTLTRTDFTLSDGAPVGTSYPETVIGSGVGSASIAAIVLAEIDRRTNGVPVVGGPATYTLATDSYACTVISVDRKGTRVTLRRDKATLINGVNSGEPDALAFEPGGFFGHTSGRQRYAYEANPDGETFVMTRRVRRCGEVVWKEVGHDTKAPGCTARFVARSEHYDFNF